MAQLFKSGDVVRLKSGGPKMTVSTYKKITPFKGQPYDTDTEVICEWFDGNTPYDRIFHQDSLEKVTETAPPLPISGGGKRESKHSY